MSYRGRVIRRQPVSCYLRPQSIQQQKEKFIELASVFGATFAFAVSRPTHLMIPDLQKVGLIGPFPYPDIAPEELTREFAVEDPIWLRLSWPMFFTANSALQIGPELSPARKVVVVVDKSGAVPEITQIKWLESIRDSGEVIDVYCNESIFTDRKGTVTIAATTGLQANPVETPQDRTQIFADGEKEVYVVLWCCQNHLVAGLNNNLMVYSLPIDARDWFRNEESS